MRLLHWAWRTLERPVITTGAGSNRHQGRYQATKAQPLVTLFELLNLSRESTFVDCSSDKGRVLLIAARHGFRRVRGIEFSNELCNICGSNVQQFRRWLGGTSTIAVIEADATRYEYPPDEGVYFMYHPFDVATLGRVLQRIADSRRASPRKLTLIYNVPVHHQVVLSSGLFASWKAHELPGGRFIVYETVG